MNNVAISTRTQLAARELLALDNAEGVRIECVSGELWITTEGGAGAGGQPAEACQRGGFLPGRTARL